MICDMDTSVLSIATSLIGKDCANVHFTLPDKVITKRKKRWHSLIKKYEQLAVETKEPEELYIYTLERVSNSNLPPEKTLEEGSWEDRPLYVKTRASVQRWINSQSHFREIETCEMYPPLEQEKLATDASSIESEKILTNPAKGPFLQKVSRSINSENSESVNSENSESVNSENSESVNSENSESVNSENSESVNSENSESVNSENSESVNSENAESVNSENSESVNSENSVLLDVELQPMGVANLECMKEQVSGLNLTPLKEVVLSADDRNIEFTNSLLLKNRSICRYKEKPLFTDKEKLETTKNQVTENIGLQKEKLLSAHKENPETIEKWILENHVMNPVPQKEEMCTGKDKGETTENQVSEHHVTNTVLQEKKLICANKENVQPTRNRILENIKNPFLQKEEILCVGKENIELTKAQILENHVINVVLQKEEILCADENDQRTTNEIFKDHVQEGVLHTGTENLRTAKKNVLNYKMNCILRKNDNSVMEVGPIKDYSLRPIIKLERCDNIILARKENPVLNVSGSENLGLKKRIVQECLSDEDCVQPSMDDVSTVILHPLLSCETERMIPYMRTRLKSFHCSSPAVSDTEHGYRDLVVNKGVEENVDIFDNSIKAIESLCNNTTCREVTEETSSFAGNEVGSHSWKPCRKYENCTSDNYSLDYISHTSSKTKDKSDVRNSAFGKARMSVDELETESLGETGMTVNGLEMESVTKQNSCEYSQFGTFHYTSDENFNIEDILKIHVIKKPVTEIIDIGNMEVKLFNKPSCSKQNTSIHTGSMYNENIQSDNKKDDGNEQMLKTGIIRTSLAKNMLASVEGNINSSEVESCNQQKTQEKTNTIKMAENAAFSTIKDNTDTSETKLCNKQNKPSCSKQNTSIYSHSIMYNEDIQSDNVFKKEVGSEQMLTPCIIKTSLAKNMLANVEGNIDSSEAESCSQQKTRKKTNVIKMIENAESTTVKNSTDITESCNKQKTKNNSHHSKYNKEDMFHEIFEENNVNIEDMLTPNNIRKAVTVNTSFSDKGNIDISEVKSFSKRKRRKSSYNENILLDNIFSKHNMSTEDVLITNNLRKSLNGYTVLASGKSDTDSSEVETFSKRKRRKSSHPSSYNENILFDNIFSKHNMSIEDVLVTNNLRKSLNGNTVLASGKSDTDSSEVESFNKRKTRKSSHLNSYNEDILFDNIFSKHNMSIEDVLVTNNLRKSLNGNTVLASGKSDTDSSEVESFNKRKIRKSSHLNSYNEDILFDNIFSKHNMSIEDVLVTNDATESLDGNTVSVSGKGDRDSSEAEPVRKQISQKCSYLNAVNDFSSGCENKSKNVSTEDILTTDNRKKSVTENLFSKSRELYTDISEIQSFYKQKTHKCSQLGTHSKNVNIHVNSVHNENRLRQKQRTCEENIVKSLLGDSIETSQTESSNSRKSSYSRVAYDSIIAFDDIFDKTNFMIEDILTPKHRKFLATVNKNTSENDSENSKSTAVDKGNIQESKHKSCLDFSEKTLNVAEIKKLCTQTDSIKIKHHRVGESKCKGVRQDHGRERVKENCSDSDVILLRTPTADNMCKTMPKRRVKWLGI